MTEQTFDGLGDEEAQEARKKWNLPEPIEASDIARSIVWLLSENSANVNGVSLPVGEGAP